MENLGVKKLFKELKQKFASRSNESSGSKTTVITFGTFDLLHIGHINILERASRLGDRLVVGISSDQLNYKKKQIYPIMSEENRMKIIASLTFVNDVFLEESLEQKGDYITTHRADILVMGDDWRGKFDHYNEICKVVYLSRTPAVSTTEIRTKIQDVMQ